MPHFSIEGLSRLATDTGFSKAAICRLANQQSNPSYRIAEAIAWAISKRSGIHIDPREIFSRDGTYPTTSVCDLMGCQGCFPPHAWDEETDTLKPDWRHQKPGEWSRRQADLTSPGSSI